MKNKLSIARIFLMVGLLSLVLSACNLPALTGNPAGGTPAVVAHNPDVVTPDPNGTTTPTPFMPINPTSTSMPTEVSTPDPELAGIEADSDSYMGRLQRPEGQVNILLLGSDFRPMKGYRTDVILLVSLNTRTGTASVVSFPRDLYVMMPGWEMNRINTAQAHGGFEMTVDTFEYNFGVTPDHYVMTNFDGFKGIIDSLGGIDINSEQAFSDRCDLPQGVNKYCSIGVGTYHMDGEMALWYVRARYSTSDFDRLRRAQEVIQGIFVKMLTLDGITRAPELYDLFKTSVETDMTLADILTLLPMATKLTDTNQVKRFAVSQDYVTPWMTEGGASVQIPDQEKIWNEIITDAVYGQ